MAQDPFFYVLTSDKEANAKTRAITKLQKMPRRAITEKLHLTSVQITVNRVIRTQIFLKIGLRHFSRRIRDYLHAKNLINPMVGSMIIFVTHRHTDIAGYIGPAKGRVDPKSVTSSVKYCRFR